MPITNAYELISDMGLGWNWGNGFDCHKAPPYAYDRNDLYSLARLTPTQWGNQSPSLLIADALKLKGFNSIRLTTTW